MIRGSSSCTGMLYTSAYVGCLVSYILIDIQAYILSCSVQFMLWHHSCLHNVNISELGLPIIETDLLSDQRD